MDADERLRLRAKAQGLEAAMNIGKQGVSESVAEEVRRQLEDHRLMKVRFLPAARGEGSSAEMAEDLARRAGAELVEVRGHTAVLWKPRARRSGPRQRPPPGAREGTRGARGKPR
jgi:RNA-binding protein